MDLAQAEREAHDRFITHIMPCRACHSPVKRYCFDGRMRLIDYLAHYLMGQDLYTRRVHLSRIEANENGLVDDLKARMIVIHEQIQAVSSEESGHCPAD